MITLTKDMEIGVPKVDGQHRELVDRINALTKMGAKSVSKEETERTLKLLTDYVILHFRDEEALHKQSNYPKIEQHKIMHQAYLKELESLKKEFDANGVSAKFTLDINKSVINWIVRHIKSADVEFGKFYNDHPNLR